MGSSLAEITKKSNEAMARGDGKKLLFALLKVGEQVNATGARARQTYLGVLRAIERGKNAKLGLAAVRTAYQIAFRQAI
jgi:hypothetical protein